MACPCLRQPHLTLDSCSSTSCLSLFPPSRCTRPRGGPNIELPCHISLPLSPLDLDLPTLWEQQHKAGPLGKHGATTPLPYPRAAPCGLVVLLRAGLHPLETCSCLVAPVTTRLCLGDPGARGADAGLGRRWCVVVVACSMCWCPFPAS